MNEIRSLWKVPSIGHFCSLFRETFDLPEFDIEELEDALVGEDSERGCIFITDIICRLLNGYYSRKDITQSNYELYLKHLFNHHYTEEKRGDHPFTDCDFTALSVATKIDVLHELCDYRLYDDGVEEQLRGVDSNNLRLIPLGWDAAGASYWYFYGTRLYKEIPQSKRKRDDSKKRRSTSKCETKEPPKRSRPPPKKADTTPSKPPVKRLRSPSPPSNRRRSARIRGHPNIDDDKDSKDDEENQEEEDEVQEEEKEDEEQEDEKEEKEDSCSDEGYNDDTDVESECSSITTRKSKRLSTTTTKHSPAPALRMNTRITRATASAPSLSCLGNNEDSNDTIDKMSDSEIGDKISDKISETSDNIDDDKSNDSVDIQLNEISKKHQSCNKIDISTKRTDSFNEMVSDRSLNDLNEMDISELTDNTLDDTIESANVTLNDTICTNKSTDDTLDNTDVSINESNAPKDCDDILNSDLGSEITGIHSPTQNELSVNSDQIIENSECESKLDDNCDMDNNLDKGDKNHEKNSEKTDSVDAKTDFISEDIKMDICDNLDDRKDAKIEGSKEQLTDLKTEKLSEDLTENVSDIIGRNSTNGGIISANGCDDVKTEDIENKRDVKNDDKLTKCDTNQENCEDIDKINEQNIDSEDKVHNEVNDEDNEENNQDKSNDESEEEKFVIEKRVTRRSLRKDDVDEIKTSENKDDLAPSKMTMRTRGNENKTESESKTETETKSNPRCSSRKRNSEAHENKTTPNKTEKENLPKDCTPDKKSKSESKCLDFENDFSAQTGWYLVCSTADQWESFVDGLEGSTVRCERELRNLILDSFLPELPALEQAKDEAIARKLEEMAPKRSDRIEMQRLKLVEQTGSISSKDEIQRKLQEMAPKRSDRIEMQRLKLVEQQKELALLEEEESRQKVLLDEQRGKVLEKQRQAERNKRLQERERIKLERAKRLEMREARAKYIAEGEDIPPELQHSGSGLNDKGYDDLDDEMITTLHKVYDAVKMHKHSWPFWEPVDTKIAPDYYQCITHPIDLSTIEQRLDNAVYTSREEFIADFKLMFENCYRYNGRRNELSHMARSLDIELTRALEKYAPDMEYTNFDDDLTMDYYTNPRLCPKRAASSRARKVVHKAAADIRGRYKAELSDEEDTPKSTQNSNPSSPTKRRTPTSRNTYRLVNNSDGTKSRIRIGEDAEIPQIISPKINRKTKVVNPTLPLTSAVNGNKTATVDPSKVFLYKDPVTGVLSLVNAAGKATMVKVIEGKSPVFMSNVRQGAVTNTMPKSTVLSVKPGVIGNSTPVNSGVSSSVVSCGVSSVGVANSSGNIVIRNLAGVSNVGVSQLGVQNVGVPNVGVPQLGVAPQAGVSQLGVPPQPSVSKIGTIGNNITIPNSQGNILIIRKPDGNQLNITGKIGGGISLQNTQNVIMTPSQKFAGYVSKSPPETITADNNVQENIQNSTLLFPQKSADSVDISDTFDTGVYRGRTEPVLPGMNEIPATDQKFINRSNIMCSPTTSQKQFFNPRRFEKKTSIMALQRAKPLPGTPLTASLAVSYNDQFLAFSQKKVDVINTGTTTNVDSNNSNSVNPPVILPVYISKNRTAVLKKSDDQPTFKWDSSSPDTSPVKPVKPTTVSTGCTAKIMPNLDIDADVPVEKSNPKNDSPIVVTDIHQLLNKLNHDKNTENVKNDQNVPKISNKSTPLRDKMTSGLPGILQKAKSPARTPKSVSFQVTENCNSSNVKHVSILSPSQNHTVVNKNTNIVVNANSNTVVNNDVNMTSVTNNDIVNMKSVLNPKTVTNIVNKPPNTLVRTDSIGMPEQLFIQTDHIPSNHIQTDHIQTVSSAENIPNGIDVEPSLNCVVDSSEMLGGAPILDGLSPPILDMVNQNVKPIQPILSNYQENQSVNSPPLLNVENISN